MTAHRNILLLVAATGILLFGTAVTFPFVWDDEGVVLRSEAVQARNPIRVFTSSYFPSEPGHNQQYVRYRPLTSLSFWLDRRLWGNSPAGFHATSILLHLFNACLLYGLAWALTSNLWASGLAAFFFLIHPAQPQAVTFVASRGDLIAASFSLLFLWAHRRFLRQKGGSIVQMAPVWGSYLAAILSKEVTFLLPVLLLGYDRLYFSGQLDRDQRRRLLVERVGLVVVFVVYMGLRSLFAPIGNMQWVTSIRGGSWVLGQTVASSLAWLIGPLERRFPEAFVPQDPWWWGVLCLLAAAGIFFICWRRVARGGLGAVVALGAGWGVLALGPVSNILFVAAPPFAPNYLYLPLLGFSLALGSVLAFWMAHKSSVVRIAALTGAAALAVFWIPQAHAIHRHWGDPLKIAKQNIGSKFPMVTGFYHDLVAQDELEKGRYESALKLSQSAIQIEPESADYQTNLGLALQGLGRAEEAEKAYRRTIELDPDSAEAYNNLASLMLKRGESSHAAELAEKAIALMPQMGEAHANLAEAYWRVGRRPDALKQWESAAQFAQKNNEIDIKMIYAQRLAEYGLLAKSLDLYRELVEKHPAHPGAQLGLAVTLGRQQIWEESLAAHRKALELSPRNPDSLIAYGVTLARMGRFSEAVVAWRKALELDPERPDVVEMIRHAQTLESSSAGQIGSS